MAGFTDAANAFLIMKMLRDVARSSNVAIIASLHQPSEVVFQQADMLLLLGTGGKQVYHGPVDGVLDHFEQHVGLKKPAALGRADWCLELVK